MITYVDTSAILKLVVDEPESAAAADVARSDLMYAAALPGRLRSADAIHLATAIRLQADLMIAYDGELLAAAVDAGIPVLSPGK